MSMVGREIGPNWKFSQKLILAFKKTHTDDKKSNAIEKKPLFFQGHSQMHETFIECTNIHFHFRCMYVTRNARMACFNSI